MEQHDAQLPNLLAGNTYIHIHTVKFPGGEIRGPRSWPSNRFRSPPHSGFSALALQDLRHPAAANSNQSVSKTNPPVWRVLFVRLCDIGSRGLRLGPFDLINT